MKLTREIISGVTAILVAILVGIGSVQAQGNVVEVVENSDDHTIFAELLVETELDDLLKQEGPYTVLAPTDEAFEELGSDFEALREDSEKLQNVVISHLFNDEVSADAVEQAKPVTIVEGDIEASNGTVHVVDEVMTE